MVYRSSDYTSINPAINDSSEIDLLIFSGFVARDGDANIIPCLAESSEHDEATNIYILKEAIRYLELVGIDHPKFYAT